MVTGRSTTSYRCSYSDEPVQQSGGIETRHS
jgi:hypothetical protein